MTAIRVWAPNAARVRVVTDGAERDLRAGADGWWDGPDLAPGTDYAFRLDDDTEALPDPTSRWQPDGVHGPSRVYDQSTFAWTDGSWSGRALPGAVIYELHVGTFTPGASLDSAIERLDHLVDLGITHVELLPLNAVNGVWNWGYDGVDWYAVHEPYGGPEAFKRFVDAAHRRGLAVVLDVVYNHLGPSGNYLPHFGPYLKAGHNTWGDLINFDEPAVRAFVIENALMWLAEFHVDALRLDAVHALHDESPVHILVELSERVAGLAVELGRPLSLIAESDLNDPIMITARAAGGRGTDAQWDDDVHHALHATLTGERHGYYCDFGSLTVLAKAFTDAFVHDGTYSGFRGREHGRPVDREHVPGWRFVACLQNHDQVGNRAAGERLPELTSPGLLRVGALLLLSGPFTPMLWMGEEWAASTRWPFFTSHPQADLAARTGPGRIAEFEGYGWDVTGMTDPQDPAAYRESVLDWSEPNRPGHREMLEFYRELIALRARTPELADPDLSRVHVEVDEAAQLFVLHRGALRVVANFAATPAVIDRDGAELVFATADAALEEGNLRLPGQSGAIVSVGHPELPDR